MAGTRPNQPRASPPTRSAGARSVASASEPSQSGWGNHDSSRPETTIARAIRKQGCKPCREVTIELPFNESGFLETTIIYPASQPEPSNPLARSTNAIAILLHPWSRVGGNAHDPVLLSFLSSFIRRDYHVITYNSRGVGNSSGSPTWTGFGEAEDLQKVVSLALQEIEEVEEIVLLGYSYGSLAVSMHPARPSALFSAANLARNRHVSPKLRIRHVLLSYPQGVLWLLSFFHSKRYDEALKELINSPGADVLVLYGEHDQFTKKEKYTTWANGLRASFASGEQPSVAKASSRERNGSPNSSPTNSNNSSSSAQPTAPQVDMTPIPNPKLQIEVVPEADHFWRSKSSTIRAARAIVENWLDGIGPSSGSNVAGRARPTSTSGIATPGSGLPSSQAASDRETVKIDDAPSILSSRVERKAWSVSPSSSAPLDSPSAERTEWIPDQQVEGRAASSQ